MDRPDICFVSYNLYSYLKPGSSKNAGGAERQQYLIARELVDRGYNVSAIVGDYGQEKHEGIDGIDVWRAYSSVGASGYKSNKGKIRFPIQVGKLIYTINKVNAKNYYTRSTLYYPILNLCSKITGFNYYCGLSHDRDVKPSFIESKNTFFKKLYLRSLREAELVISQTEFQQDKLYESYGIESTVIRNGRLIPECDERNPEYFLWVGRADCESKNPEKFLDLAKQLSDYEFTMIVAPGQNDEYFQILKRRAESLENVRFEGFVSPNKIQKYYRSAYCLVNTSSGEGFPNTFLEAWSVGTPVISLNVDLDGLLVQRQIGRYSGTFKQLVNDTKELAQREDLNTKLGENGRNYTIEKHSIEKITDRFETVLL